MSFPLFPLRRVSDFQKKMISHRLPETCRIDKHGKLSVFSHFCSVVLARLYDCFGSNAAMEDCASILHALSPIFLPKFIQCHLECGNVFEGIRFFKERDLAMTFGAKV